jgi:predicted RNA-binding Zn ribbon-like protein
VPAKSGNGKAAFTFLGGRACLDLTATFGDWRGCQAERLRTPQDLANWLVRTGLTDEPPAVSQQDLAQARTLREAIYQTIKRRMTGQPPGADHLAIINNWAAQPTPGAWLQAEDGQLHVRQDTTTGAALLASLARDAVGLLGGPLAGRLRECNGEDCGLLFLDTSRAGRRRWCSMGTCGARDKMAAYRARRLRPRSEQAPACSRAAPEAGGESGSTTRPPRSAVPDAETPDSVRKH